MIQSFCLTNMLRIANSISIMLLCVSGLFHTWITLLITSLLFIYLRVGPTDSLPICFEIIVRAAINIQYKEKIFKDFSLKKRNTKKNVDKSVFVWKRESNVHVRFKRFVWSFTGFLYWVVVTCGCKLQECNQLLTLVLLLVPYYTLWSWGG